jgi:hypothetical protein
MSDYSVIPYLLVVVLCLFGFLVSAVRHREKGDRKGDGPHASWRVSEMVAPRFWHVTRRKDRGA